MNSPLLDAIELVKLVNESSSNINTGLAETMNKLEEVFHSSHPQASEDFYYRLEEIIKQGTQVQAEFQKTHNFLQQLNSCKSLLESVQQFKTQFQDFFPSNLLQDLEKIEDEIKADEADRALRLSLLELMNVVEIKACDRISFGIFKIYQFLSKLLEMIEKYTSYISKDLLEITKKIAEVFLEILEECELDDKNESEKEYLINSKAKAKAILWDTSHYPKKSKKRFKTVDELFEYWDDKYDDDEVEKSLESLMSGIDFERKRQGGRTLFS